LVIPFWPPPVVIPHPFWCQLWLESELESSPLGLGGLCLFVCLFVCMVVPSIPLVLMLLPVQSVCCCGWCCSRCCCCLWAPACHVSVVGSCYSGFSCWNEDGLRDLDGRKCLSLSLSLSLVTLLRPGAAIGQSVTAIRLLFSFPLPLSFFFF